LNTSPDPTVLPELTPTMDEDSSAFWQALRDRRISLQHCNACQRLRYPPMPTCPYCGSRDASLAPCSGRGVVYSWIRVERALDPGRAAEVPYTFGIIRLEEGPRIAARIEGDADFDTKVEARFIDHTDWTELRFVSVD
jgi:uncharacterized protein